MLSVKKTTMHFKETIRLGILTRPHIYIRYRKFLLFIKKRQLEKKGNNGNLCIELPHSSDRKGRKEGQVFLPPSPPPLPSPPSLLNPCRACDNLYTSSP